MELNQEIAKKVHLLFLPPMTSSTVCEDIETRECSQATNNEKCFVGYLVIHIENHFQDTFKTHILNVKFRILRVLLIDPTNIVIILNEC